MHQILSTTTYNIVVGDFYPILEQYLLSKQYSQHFILVDENTKRDCLPILQNKLPLLQAATIIDIQSGEIHKNLDTCQDIWQQLLAKHADRKAVVLNLGGGVIGDMGGFVAATYKRGIDFIQIPTTLLAQVDASIGGKLGIDFSHVKNIIGCFQNPQMVCIDPAFLGTLPQRQVLNGFAEIIKHALIADADYWADLKQITLDNINQIDWIPIILRSLRIKKYVVESDPYEKGLRKILNFGHTIGHAIESYSLAHDEDALLHGEAIILGMLAELQLSVKYENLEDEAREEVSVYVKKLYPNLFEQKQTHKSIEVPLIMAYLKNDKKNERQVNQQVQFNFTLLTALGESLHDRFVDVFDIDSLLNKYSKTTYA